MLNLNIFKTRIERKICYGVMLKSLSAVNKDSMFVIILHTLFISQGLDLVLLESTRLTDLFIYRPKLYFIINIKLL